MRLIDADALNDILEYMINEADIKSWGYVREPVVAHHYEMLKQQIEEILTGISGLPTIESTQPEIIRCKNCKHRDSNDCPMYYEEWIEIDEGDGYFDTDNIIHDWTTDEGFCHCAELRGEQDE